MGRVTSIEAGERGIGGCPVGGTAWLGIAWRMNWSNNLTNFVEAVRRCNCGSAVAAVK